eukprot:631944-Rhodomonas_salina.1
MRREGGRGRGRGGERRKEERGGKRGGRGGGGGGGGGVQYARVTNTAYAAPYACRVAILPQRMGWPYGTCARYSCGVWGGAVVLGAVSRVRQVRHVRRRWPRSLLLLLLPSSLPPSL